MKKLSLVVFSVLPFGMFQSAQAQHTHLKPLKTVEKIALYGAGAWTGTLIGHLIHEGGHATALKLLFGSPIKIALWGKLEDPSLVEFCGIGLKSLWLKASYTAPPPLNVIKLDTNRYSKLACVMFAGPVAGLLFWLTIYKISYEYNCKFFKYLALYGLAGNLYDLTPLRSHDGFKGFRSATEGILTFFTPSRPINIEYLLPKTQDFSNSK